MWVWVLLCFLSLPIVAFLILFFANTEDDDTVTQKLSETQKENLRKSLYNKVSQDQHVDNYNYVIDAIDSVNDKTDLIIRASHVRGCKVFSSMGAALRFDPTQVRVAELFDVKGDALAKAVRARMKKLDLRPYKKIRCVYSLEQAQRCETRGSLMQVTAVFGCTLASLIIRDLL